MFSKHGWLCSPRVRNCPTLPLAIPVSCLQFFFFIHLMAEEGLVSSWQRKSQYSYKAEIFLYPRPNFKFLLNLVMLKSSYCIHIHFYLILYFYQSHNLNLPLFICPRIYALKKLSHKEKGSASFLFPRKHPGEMFLTTKWDIYFWGIIPLDTKRERTGLFSALRREGHRETQSLSAIN